MSLLAEVVDREYCALSRTTPTTTKSTKWKKIVLAACDTLAAITNEYIIHGVSGPLTGFLRASGLGVTAVAGGLTENTYAASRRLLHVTQASSLLRKGMANALGMVMYNPLAYITTSATADAAYMWWNNLNISQMHPEIESQVGCLGYVIGASAIFGLAFPTLETYAPRVWKGAKAKVASLYKGSEKPIIPEHVALPQTV